MKNPLVSNWRQAHKFLSVQIAGAAVVFGLLPPDQQSAIMAWIGLTPERIPAAIGALFIVGRLWKQPEKTQA